MPFRCYDLLNCFIQHSKSCHKTVFNGKYTKFPRKNEYFKWFVSEEKPSLKHSGVCEDGRKARKRQINTGTKQRSRLTSKISNLVNEYENFESEKHSDEDLIAGHKFFVVREKAIRQEYQIHNALHALIYKPRGSIIKFKLQIRKHLKRLVMVEM